MKLTIDKRVDNFYKSTRVIKIVGEISPTIEQREQVGKAISLLLENGKVPSNGWYTRLAYFHKYSIDPSTWVDRITTILNDPKSNTQTLSNMILMYGEQEGNRRWEEYRGKQAVSNTFEYKKKKFGWSKEQFDEYNQSRAVTLDNLVKKYGEMEGEKKWKNYCERQSYTNSLEYFIEKYGKSDGEDKWKEYNIEKSKSVSPLVMAEYLSISVEEAAKIFAERTKLAFVSEAEKRFIEQLGEVVDLRDYYSFQNKQFSIWSHEARSIFFYDLCSTKTNKIIEFNGDYWHANPKKYSPDTIIKQTGKTAREIWMDDQIKIRAANLRGFTVKVVWESEFIENGIDDVVDFLLS